ncbi:MAG TPA: 4-hydroxy-tetrahydrodipicolinate synthase [Iamia sp.]|jgi:4-hydroxy-tetrahydrodipicolinate synthase|nr:4-hydroxy-tetrahydrodipicolinate synthase [Iamia sp.]
MPRFGRVLTAMATPFAPDGTLDAKAAGDLARWLVDHGNDGLVVAGTTGESPVLTDEERIELLRAVRAAVDVPVIAGTTTNDTAHSVALTEAAAEVGVDGILAVTPYYSKPPQSGLRLHFEAIAAASDLPVMLYDVPGRAGREIATDTIVGLAHDVPTIVALKDAGGRPERAGPLLAAAPPDFEVYSGDEPLTLSFLAHGAVGVVGVASHWTAALQADMFFAFEAGDTAGARAIHARLLASYAFMNTDECVFSQAVKVMMAELGVPLGDCRLPLGPAPEDTVERARTVARDLRLLV